MGGVYRRGEWFWYHFSVNGTLIRKPANTKDEEEARRIYWQARLAHGLNVPVTNVSFDDLERLYLDHAKLNGLRSIPRIKGAFKNLRPFFGGSKVSSITTTRLTAYANMRHGQAAPATIKYELSILRKTLRLAHRSDLIQSVPVIPTISVDNVRSGFLEDEQFWSVYGHLPDNVRNPIEFLFWTGWRLNDALKLEWRQVDRNHGTIVLERGTTKNKAGRVLPYRAMPELDAIIEAEWERRDPTDPRVFRMNETTLREAWNKAREKAGLPNALLHDFRRGAARRYIRKGVQEKVVMQLLGMKTRSILDRYLVTREDDLAAALALVSKRRKAKKKPSNRNDD